MQQREKLVRAALSGHATVAELCRRAGVSRKTAYKWIGRFEQRGLAGLSDQSRARHEQAGRVSDAVTDEILAARHAHPTWGARKLHQRLTEVLPGSTL
jgi:transposase-like protein